MICDALRVGYILSLIDWSACHDYQQQKVTTNAFVRAYVERLLDERGQDTATMATRGKNTGKNNSINKKSSIGTDDDDNSDDDDDQVGIILPFDAITFDEFVHVFWVFSVSASKHEKTGGIPLHTTRTQTYILTTLCFTLVSDPPSCNNDLIPPHDHYSGCFAAVYSHTSRALLVMATARKGRPVNTATREGVGRRESVFKSILQDK